jgi:hypothetical protein
VTGDGCLVIEQATFEDGADALPHLIRSGNRRLAAKA